MKIATSVLSSRRSKRAISLSFLNYDQDKLKRPTADEAQHLKPRAETSLVKGFRNLTEQYFKVSAVFNPTPRHKDAPV